MHYLSNIHLLSGNDAEVSQESVTCVGSIK